MTDFFKVQGRALLANGYQIIPIKPGEKRPALAAWQNARLSAADLSSYPGHGVGVLCGQGAFPVVGLDIDISHPTIGPSLIEWCRKWLPGAPERVGAAPRVLLVYRASEAGWTKGSSTAFLDPADPLKPNGKENQQRIEVLGFGQQFVAYHVHPDTQQPYEWDMMGGLEYTRASDLPLITESQLADLMAEVDRLVRAQGDTLTVISVGEASRVVGASTDDWLAGLVPPTNTPITDVIALLAYMKDANDYDTWLRVGMALHHEYHGAEEAFNAWATWSAQSAKYDVAALRMRWPSFGSVGGRAPTTLRWLLKVAGEAKRDAEMAAARERVDAAKLRIARAKDSLEMSGKLARDVRDLMPEDSLARAEIFKAYQVHFKALSGIAMPISDVKKLLAPPAAKNPTVRAHKPLTEFGNVARMLDRYGAGMMYVPELDRWYLWTGVYWRAAGSVEIEHYAKETIRALINEVDEHENDIAEFYDFCKTSQRSSSVKAIVSLAMSDPRVLVPVAELDKHAHLLGVRNGVVDLRTGTLLPADPEYRITMVAGCDYVPGTQCPLFKQTIGDVFFNDVDMMRFFHRLCGYSLMGDPKADVLIIPYGNGSNGKSTILNTVRDTFGHYGKSSAAETFVSSAGAVGGSGGGPREDIVRLKGARFVYVNEPDENSELRESAVKSMSGGDSIPARALFARVSIEIEATWAAWMPTNHKPVIKGNDNGIWRRVVLVPFLRNFDADATIAKDEDRQEKLAAEMPGVLAWLVQGALRYQQEGLALPAAIRAAREEYREQMDVLADWLAESCEIGPQHTETSMALWNSWSAWAQRNGAANYIRSAISLGKRLENRFPSSRGNSGQRRRSGLRVKTDLSPFSEVGK